MDPSSLLTGVGAGLSPEDCTYLLSKLVTMTLSQACLAGQKQQQLAEMEHNMKQVIIIYIINIMVVK